MATETRTPADYIESLNKWWDMLMVMNSGLAIGAAFSPGMDQMEAIALDFKAEHPKAFEKWLKERD